MTVVPHDGAHPRVDILGVQVSVLSKSSLLKDIRRAVDRRSRLRVAFCNVHTVAECQSDDLLRTAVNSSEVVAPDGMPLVWVSRSRGFKNAQRVSGPNTFAACCEFGLQYGFRHYFFGSTQDTLDALTRNLLQHFPGIIIAGSYSPPFRTLTEAEDEEALARINESFPDILWIGLGMPKQELWTASHEERLKAPVLMPVGAAFAFHAGTVRRAPYWMQQFGLEWVFRLCQEPRRLWRRYLLGNSRFLYLLAKQQLNKRQKA